jgi:HNH endonuclease
MIKSLYPQLNDEAWLRQQYVVEQRTQADIAAEVGCEPRAIWRALRRFDIKSERRKKLKPRGSRYLKLRDRDWLADQIQTRTIRQIAGEVGCSSAAVFQATVRLGIPIPERLMQPTLENIESMQQALRERYPQGRFGPESANWRGGRRKQNGYIFIYAPDHPRANAKAAVQEHILVMEKMLGRYLKPGEIVHHKNHVKDDNRPENLYLTKNGQHIREHFAEGKRAAAAEARTAQLEAEVARLREENARLKAELTRFSMP